MYNILQNNKIVSSWETKELAEKELATLDDTYEIVRYTPLAELYKINGKWEFRMLR